jgi:hypothetical protein
MNSRKILTPAGREFDHDTRSFAWFTFYLNRSLMVVDDSFGNG